MQDTSVLRKSDKKCALCACLTTRLDSKTYAHLDEIRGERTFSAVINQAVMKVLQILTRKARAEADYARGCHKETIIDEGPGYGGRDICTEGEHTMRGGNSV